jgi:hypothetical protein
MWECKKCGENIEDEYNFCRNCGYEREGKTMSSDQDFAKHREHITKNPDVYVSGRIIASMVFFLGWISLVISIVFTLATFLALQSHGGFNIIEILPGLYGAFSGLLLILFGQFTMATIDNANSTKMILHFLKHRG